MSPSQIVVFTSAVSLALSATYLAVSGHTASAVATITCLVCLTPLALARRFDFFTPWNYMLYFVVLNVVIRGVLIDFDITGGIVDLDDAFYLGKPHNFLIAANGVLLVGFLFLTFGYVGTRSRLITLPFRIFNGGSHDAIRLKRTVTMMLLVSTLAFVLFVRLTFEGVDEFAIGVLSKHRGVSEDLAEYKAYGYLRLLIGLATLAVYLSYLGLRRPHGHAGYYRLMLVLSITVSVAMAFYSQGRAALIFVFLDLIFMKYYLDDRRLPLRSLAIACPVAIALFAITSALRGGSGISLKSELTPMTIIAPIVLNNGGIDASKTGHVIDYTTDNQDYKFGQTLVQFAWAVVPRQIWTTKPTNLDTYVGEKIYGAETFGATAVPPGFFAEMYMNFWYAGVVIGAVALGALMKYLLNLLISYRKNVNFVVFYVTVLQSIGLSVLSSGVSSTIMGVLMTGIPLALALSYITIGSAGMPQTRSSHQHA